MARVGEREVRGHLFNLSASGASIWIPVSELKNSAPPGPGADVNLRLSLPQQVRPLTCGGTVVWVEPHNDSDPEPAIRLGITLSEVDAAELNRLGEVLEKSRYVVVVLEHSAADLAFVRQALGSEYRLCAFSAPADALEFIEEHDPAVVLIGEPLSDGNVSDFLARCAERVAPPAARIVMSRSDPAAVMPTTTGFPSIFYWLQKPGRPAVLQQVVSRATEAYALALGNEQLTLELERINDKLQRENSFLRRKLDPVETVEGMVGTSAEFQKALGELRAAQRSDSTVHIHGETGTGKELLARALHFGGLRAAGPFVAQNCAGMAESLLQSTLFGHRKGAFTGADRDHRGVFEQASGGTLFLDEVAELSWAVQTALLRVVETGSVTPVGSASAVRVDVRLVSATHRELRQEALAGRFREDLLFRILVVPVHAPPLRDRSGDTVLLANHFLQIHSQHHGRQLPALAPEVLEAFVRYRWPGNIRELENEVERLVVLAEERQPVPLHLVSAHVREGAAAAPPAPRDDSETVFIPAGTPYDEAIAQLQRSLVTRALGDANGRVAVAAQLLKVERSRLGKLRKRLGLEPLVSAP